MKYTADQIADAADKSIFYITEEGLWLRIEYCNMEEGYLQASDEDSGEEYRIGFEEIMDLDSPNFQKLVPFEFEKNNDSQ